MSELERVELIRRRLGPVRDARIVRAVGDDCAILRPPGAREDWVLSTDLVVEDVHFRRDTHLAADVGYKALARALSDLAAMGATPCFSLISLALPDWVDEDWLAGFYDGLGKAAAAGAPVIGGDLSSARQLVCDVVVCGAVPPDEAMRRDRARIGDQLYVSGTLGGSALGLATGAGEGWQRHLRPQPQLELGRFLREQGVRAAMDLSDGLSIDLHRLALESGVAAVIDRPVPRFPGATDEQAIHGGEDYELLFAVPREIDLPAAYEDVPLTRIGGATAGEPGAVTYLGQPLSPAGWDHFRRT